MATDATGLAARIRRGDITAVEAVDTAIARIEALQPQLNFLVSDYVRPRTRPCESRNVSGPFGGVPYLIKDMFDVIGSVTRYGSRFSAVLPPATHQGAMIDAIEASGLIIVGRSALGEFGFLPTTEPLAFGPTRNPWISRCRPAAHPAARRLLLRRAWCRWPTGQMAAVRSGFPRQRVACSD